MKLSPWEPDLRTIVDRIESQDIDLQPDFQRQEVWSPSKKRKLIDTILRSWSIPPIFLVVTDEGRMEVLDGQQRLAAIRDFVQNQFSIDGRISPRDPRIEALHGKTYRRLDAMEKRLLDQYTLRCFRITDYEPDEPSELFYRLNQPSMLTAGEQRNAFYGPARAQLKQLVLRFEDAGNDKSTIGFSNGRLAYDDIIARLLFFVEANTFAIKGTESLISQRFKAKSEFEPEVVNRAGRAIEYFSTSRLEAGPMRLNKASTLSWLLFYARFEERDPETSFLGYFTKLISGSAATNYISEAHAVFQDRASLRVTDVSSVVFRDFCLWYTYYFANDKPPLPSIIDEVFLEFVRDFLRSHDDYSFEAVLGETLAPDQWSRLR